MQNRNYLEKQLRQIFRYHAILRTDHLLPQNVNFRTISRFSATVQPVFQGQVVHGIKTVSEYFRRKHRPLEYPHLPTIITDPSFANPGHLEYYPIESLNIYFFSWRDFEESQLLRPSTRGRWYPTPFQKRLPEFYMGRISPKRPMFRGTIDLRRKSENQPFNSRGRTTTGKFSNWKQGGSKTPSPTPQDEDREVEAIMKPTTTKGGFGNPRRSASPIHTHTTYCEYSD